MNAHHVPAGHNDNCDHHGQTAVHVGEFTVYPGGVEHFAVESLDKHAVLLALTSQRGEVLRAFEQFGGRIIECHLPDFGGVPPDWEEILRKRVIPIFYDVLELNDYLVPFCFASHGRTGTLIASLIAILEPEIEDPIAEARKRHCHHAVETVAQAEGIFKLKGMPVPEKYLSGPEALLP